MQCARVLSPPYSRNFFISANLKLPCSAARAMASFTQAHKEKLLGTSTCEVSDALINLGHKHGGLLPDIKHQQGASPSFQSLPFCGPAFTVKMVEASDKTSPSLSGNYVDLIPEGAVAVVQAPRHLKNACLGGLLAERAQIRGAAGIVLDGNMRDVEDMERLGFPVFARGMTTLGQKSFVRASEIGIDLEIKPQYPFVLTPEEEAKAFPPCTVHSGVDILFGDINGVVVIPFQDLEKVLTITDKIAESDAKVKEELQKGSSISDAFKKHR